MSHTQDTTTGAIDRSISHDEIVTVMVESVSVGFDELRETMPDDQEYDYVDTQGANGYPLREVWSTAGEEWRVHLQVRRA